MKFRVLAGQHDEPGPDGKRYTYGAGQIVDTPRDLDRMFNQQGVTPKFQRVYEGQDSDVAQAARQGFDPRTGNTAPTSPPLPDTLDSMNVKELQAVAAEEEVDVRNAKTKEDLVRVLRTAQTQAVARAQGKR